MSPENASKMRDRALSLHLLEINENGLFPTFDIEKVEIPRGFRPSEKYISSESSDRADHGNDSCMFRNG